MTDITIKRVEGPPDTLLHIYPGQQQPQDCFIWLDLRDGTMGADYNAEIGNAVPFDVWHGLVRRYSIPPLQPATINFLMEQISSSAEIVVGHSEIVWDGSNHVARLDGIADGAEQKIFEQTSQDDIEADVYWWDAADYFINDPEEVRQRLVSGESIDTLIEEYDGDGSSEDRPVVIGLRDYLGQLKAGVVE